MRLVQYLHGSCTQANTFNLYMSHQHADAD